MMPREIQFVLTVLGHYNGVLDGILNKEMVKKFQRHVGLAVDGICGPKTEARISNLSDLLRNAPEAMDNMAPWRMTSYYLAEQKMIGPICLRNIKGDVLANVTADFFMEASLEGTAKLLNGKLVNVDKWIAGGDEYKSVLEAYRRYAEGQVSKLRVAKPSGYFGIQNDGNKVTQAMGFRYVDTGVGYGIEKLGLPKVPFRTLAADLIPKIAKWSTHVGIVAAGTKVWVLEAIGKKLPDGSVHDGWFMVNDCGGGIFGAHFDEFVGTKEMGRKFPINERCHCWWQGMNIPFGYEHGLF
jgi:3D (Asp-Asp-Asp) domain-containing protein